MTDEIKADTTPDTEPLKRPTITVASNSKPDSAPRRRGRPPKETTPPKDAPRPPTSKAAQDRETEAALATMRNTYDLVGMGLLAYDPTLATKWNAKAEQLMAMDATLFEADPSLRQMILRFSAKSSKATFFLAHAQAVLPFGLIVATEWRAKRAQARKEKTVEVSAEDAAFYVPPQESFPNASFFE